MLTICFEVLHCLNDHPLLVRRRDAERTRATLKSNESPVIPSGSDPTCRFCPAIVLDLVGLTMQRKTLRFLNAKDLNASPDHEGGL